MHSYRHAHTLVGTPHSLHCSTSCPTSYPPLSCPTSCPTSYPTPPCPASYPTSCPTSYSPLPAPPPTPPLPAPLNVQYLSHDVKKHDRLLWIRPLQCLPKATHLHARRQHSWHTMSDLNADRGEQCSPWGQQCSPCSFLLLLCVL